MDFSHTLINAPPGGMGLVAEALLRAQEVCHPLFAQMPELAVQSEVDLCQEARLQWGREKREKKNSYFARGRVIENLRPEPRTKRHACETAWQTGPLSPKKSIVRTRVLQGLRTEGFDGILFLRDSRRLPVQWLIVQCYCASLERYDLVEFQPVPILQTRRIPHEFGFPLS